jgi:hypothetical protein
MRLRCTSLLTGLVTLVFFHALASPALARALPNQDEDPATLGGGGEEDGRSYIFPEEHWRALLGHRLRVTHYDRQVVTGQLVDRQGPFITVLVEPRGVPITIDLRHVTRLRVLDGPVQPYAPPPPSPYWPPTQQPPASPYWPRPGALRPTPRLTPAQPPVIPLGKKPRTYDRALGIHAGLPGVLAFDGAFKPVYFLFSVGIGVPAATRFQYGSYTIGLGTTFRLKRSRWSFDIFAHGTPSYIPDPRYYTYLGTNSRQPLFIFAAGVGLGFHYTFANGLDIGFKLPIAGAAGSSRPLKATQHIAYYYLNSAISFPLFSLGYRF